MRHSYKRHDARTIYTDRERTVMMCRYGTPDPLELRPDDKPICTHRACAEMLGISVSTCIQTEQRALGVAYVARLDTTGVHHG